MAIQDTIGNLHSDQSKYNFNAHNIIANIYVFGTKIKTEIQFESWHIRKSQLSKRNVPGGWYEVSSLNSKSTFAPERYCKNVL